MKILLTGFEPFDGSPVNPSQQVVEAVTDDTIVGISLIKTVLPVDYARAPFVLLEALHTHRPDAVLAFGLASGRSKISLERVALNLLDFRIPDNSGVKISDQSVIEGGPAAYFTTLPVRPFLLDFLEEGIPAEISLTAGGYLCNLVFYTIMHHISTHQLPTQAGFIHLPALPEQAAQSDKTLPSLSLELDIKAARLMIVHLSKLNQERNRNQ